MLARRRLLSTRVLFLGIGACACDAGTEGDASDGGSNLSALDDETTGQSRDEVDESDDDSEAETEEPGESDDEAPVEEVAHCGDGELQEPEECDDGNLTSADGCDLHCRFDLATCWVDEGNLLDNPGFDGSMTPWQVIDSPDFVEGGLSEESATEVRGSGAVFVRMQRAPSSETEPTTRVVAGVVQCTPAEPGAEYLLAARYFISEDEPDSTQAGFSAFYHAEADCAGDVLAAWNSPVGSERERWTLLQAKLETPERASSVSIRLNASKVVADNAATVLYDEVRLYPEALTDQVGAACPGEGPDPATPESDAGPAPTDGGGNAGESTDDEVTDDEVTDDEVTDDEVTDDEVTDDEVTDDEVTDDEVTDDEVTDPPPPPPPSYAEDIEGIFVANCVELCHTPGWLGGSDGLYPGVELDLDEGVGYEQLTGGTYSSEAPDMLLVGEDPESSYLWHKLVGTHTEVGGSGDQMPTSGALTEDELAAIRAWIEGGAAP